MYLYFAPTVIFLLVFSSTSTTLAFNVTEDEGQVREAVDFDLEDPSSTSSVENETLLSDEDDSVTETLRILAAGDQEIILDDDYRDIVLVLGNTGAGKSTITQFLAGNNSNLFSYEAEDGHFLIRDTANKISFGTTLVSKSIYPELVIHAPTNTAFYDCPGFSDTRNASVEIANAFFIKKVADHARRLKLLFIVNHSSVKSGQSRTDFKTLMEQSTSLVKNTLKFRDGTALFATKVDSGRSTESLVNGIARFLTGARRDLAQLLADPNQLQQAQDLIGSFLVQDNDDEDASKFSRIGLFRQPDELGPLSQIEIVQESKSALEKIIFNQTKFIPKNQDDFQITVSDSAKLLVSNLGTSLNDGLTTMIQNLGQILQQQFAARMQQISKNKIDLLPGLQAEVKFIQNLVTQLAPPSQQDRTQFFDTILNNFGQINCSSEIKNVLKSIELDVKKLEFLDQLSHDQTNAIPTTHAQWLHPLTLAVQNLSTEFFNFQSTIDAQVTEAMVEIGEIMENNFEHKIHHPSPAIDVHQLRHDFQILQKNMSSLLTSLQTSTDLKCFSTHVTTAIYSLEMAATNQTMALLMKISPRNDAPLIPLVGSNVQKSPYKLAQWLQPFQKVLVFIETKNLALSQRTNEAIQNCMENLGAILTRHFRSLKNALDQKSEAGSSSSSGAAMNELLSKFSTDSLIISSLLGSLKQTKFLTEFITEIENLLIKLDVEVPADFKNLSNFYKKNEEKIDLFQPISSKEASPFKPFLWTRPLESVSEILQRQMSDLSKAIEEQKRIAAEKATQEQIRKMHEETQRLQAAQEAAAKKQEEERLERVKQDREREERARQDEFRRAAQKAEEDRQAREREAQILAAQHAREQALRNQMEQIRRDLENERRRKRRKWYQIFK